VKNWSFADFFRYLLSATAWAIVFLLVTEVFLRLFIVSAVRIPAMQNGGVMEIYGYEGYGIIYYLPNMEIASTHNDGKKNIVVLGDSFTQARHVPYWKNYVSITESVMYDRGYTECNLRNFGYRGQNLAYYLGLGKSVIEAYKPEAIVLQVSFSDFDTEGFEPSDSFYFQELLDGTVVVQNGDEYKAFLKFKRTAEPALSLFSTLDFSNSSIQYAVEWQYAHLFQASPEAGNIASFNGSGLNSTRIENIISLIGSVYKDIPIVFVIIPQPKEDFSYIRRQDKNLRVISLLKEHHGWHVLYPVNEFQDSILQGNAPNGFGNTKPMYGHINSTGHRIIGEALAEELASMVKCEK